MSDRLIDRVSNDDWAKLTPDVEQVVARKIANKVNDFKKEFLSNGGQFAEPEASTEGETED